MSKRRDMWWVGLIVFAGSLSAACTYCWFTGFLS
jgi:hypothetical protein